MPASDQNTFSPPPPDKPLISVLYVDDEQDLLTIGRIYLERQGGFTVDTVSSAHEALSSGKIRSVDAIVSDYQMPGMDGIAFLKAVRDEFTDIPFILFTGRGREEIVIEAINNGADFYLQKGGDPRAQFAELAHKIRQAVWRRQAEASLHESRKQLSDIIGFLPDATFAIDREGTVIAWNRAIEEMTSVPADEMTGKGGYAYAVPFYGSPRPLLLDLVHESDEVISRYYPHVSRSGMTITAECELNLPGRGKRTVLINACPLGNQAGELAGAIESIRDITIRAEKEEALQRSYALIRAVIESPADVIIFALDTGYRYVAFNKNHSQTMRRIWGREIEPGLCMLDVIREPGDRVQAQANFDRALAGESFTVTEMYGDTCHDRRWYENTYNPIRDEDGAIIGLTVFLTDITVRRQAELTVAENEEKYSRFVENASDMLFRISIPEGKYEYMSPSSDAITGYRPDEYYADPTLLRRVIHPDWHAWFADQWADFVSGDIPSSFEFRIITKSGEDRWVNQRNVVVFGEEGIPVALEGIVTDITRQKEIEEELRKSEQRFLAATLNAGSWIWETDPDGLYTYCSPAVEEILGFAPDELVGQKHFYDLFDPSFHPGTEADAVAILASGKPFTDYININLQKDGSRVILRTSGTPLCDKDGRMTGYCGVDEDITTQKEAEDRIRESEARYRLLADNVHDLIWTVDTDLRFTYLSPSVFQLTGYHPESLLNRPFPSTLTPDSERSVLIFFNRWRRAIQEDGLFPRMEPMILEYMHQDGSTIWTEIMMTPVCDEDHHLSGFVGVTRDIQARREAEQALRESEEKFRSFVENANEFVYSLNPEGVISYLSPKMTSLLGYSPDEIRGEAIEYLVHPDDLPRARDIFIRTLTTGEHLNGNEYRIRHKDGSWRWHSQSLSPIYDHDGNLIRVLGISHDITELKKSEEVIKRANRQLGLLSGITRHDILNKTAVINGCLTLAMEDLHDPGLPEFLATMKSAADEIRSQIAFTRVYEELGSQEARWIPLDSVIPWSSLPESVTLTSDLQGLSVFADPMIEKVFFDLLDNSLRHGEHVTAIRVYAREMKGGMMVLWEDNGTGIADDEKSLIFERGYGKNTGFGMFLIREILSLTDISIRETGREGEGARFEILIPPGAFRQS